MAKSTVTGTNPSPNSNPFLESTPASQLVICSSYASEVWCEANQDFQTAL